MAVENSIQKNIDFKTYGRKLGSLAAVDRNSVLKGAEIFKSLCSSCHGTDGKGLASQVAPPIAGSNTWLIRTCCLKSAAGLSGPIDNKTYPTLMPSMADNNDEWIASVANYIRFEFGAPVAFTPPVNNQASTKPTGLQQVARPRWPDRLLFVEHYRLLSQTRVASSTAANGPADYTPLRWLN
jgi:cytochrome c553